MFTYISNNIISVINDYMLVKDDVQDVSWDSDDDDDDDKEEVNDNRYNILLYFLKKQLYFYFLCEEDL